MVSNHPEDKNPITSKRESENKIFINKISGILTNSIITLFAVLIGVTFFMDSAQLVPLKFDFRAIMIITAFVTVLLDMIGYLQTINFRPYKNSKRFVLDLVLIYLFFQLLYSSDASFEFFLGMYVIIFSFYLVWMVFEYIEYKKDNVFKKIEKLSIIRKICCVVLFLSIWIYYSTAITEKISCVGEDRYVCDYNSPTSTDWFLLLLVLAIVIGNKIVAWTQHEFARAS